MKTGKVICNAARDGRCKCRCFHADPHEKGWHGAECKGECVMMEAETECISVEESHDKSGSD